MINRPIICEVCRKEITIRKRETSLIKTYKADMVVSNDAYWNDAGIYTLIRTRRMIHKECFEDMINREKLSRGCYGFPIGYGECRSPVDSSKDL